MCNTRFVIIIIIVRTTYCTYVRLVVTKCVQMTLAGEGLLALHHPIPKPSVSIKLTVLRRRRVVIVGHTLPTRCRSYTYTYIYIFINTASRKKTVTGRKIKLKYMAKNNNRTCPNTRSLYTVLFLIKSATQLRNNMLCLVGHRRRWD